jgi:ABC-2 type transport system permease protein
VTTLVRPDVESPDTPGSVDHRPASFTGLGQLVRLVLRRDRVRLVLWVGGIVALVVTTAASIVGLYDTPEDLERYARLVRGNTALIVQAGPGYGLDDPTTGAVVMNEMGIWTLVAAALMSVFMVVRHTRTEEETERAEMIRALPVGRHAQLAAAMIGVTIANVLVATGVAVSLIAYDLPVSGSVAYSLSLIGVGSVFAGGAAVASQVASGSRTALALGGAAIAASFVLRAIGDVNENVFTWLSPLGWGQGIRAYADERWWVLVLPVLATVGLVAAAVGLQARRDMGAGLLPERAGPSVAAPRLSTPVALAWRLQRAAMFGWMFGIGLLAFFYGIVADQAESILEDNPEMEDFLAQLGEGSVLDAFLSTAVLILALTATGFTIASVLRLRSEELAGRAEPVLATPTPRWRWAAGHLAMATGGSVALMLVTGGLTGLGLSLVSGEWSKFWPIVGASLAMVPAMLVLAGAAMLLHGISPRWSLIAWGAFAYTLVIGLLGAALDLPEWTLDVSPFSHVPAMPAAGFTWTPMVALLAVAALLTVGGLRALDRRDIS